MSDTSSVGTMFINQAQVALKAIGQMQHSPNATSSLIAGSVVSELDAQIGIFNAELLAANVKKSEVRGHKVDVMAIAARAEGEFSVDGSGENDPKFKGVAVSESEKTAIESLAQNYGVDLTVKVSSDGQTVISSAQLQSLEEAVEGKLADLNSTSELKLINFQSLMDSRKQAMMMLSNILSSNNNTMMSIIQNLKS